MSASSRRRETRGVAMDGDATVGGSDRDGPGIALTVAWCEREADVQCHLGFGIGNPISAQFLKPIGNGVERIRSSDSRLAAI